MASDFLKEAQEATGSPRPDKSAQGKAERDAIEEILGKTEPGRTSGGVGSGEQEFFLSDLKDLGFVDEEGQPTVVKNLKGALEGRGPFTTTPEDQLKEASQGIRDAEQELADFQYNVAVRNQIRQANMASAQATLASESAKNRMATQGVSGTAAIRAEMQGAFAQGSILSQLGQNLAAFETSRDLGRSVIEAQQGMEDLQFDLQREARERGEILQMQQIRQANEAQQFQSTLSLIGTGAAIGASAGLPGALIGAGIGAAVSLFDF